MSGNVLPFRSIQPSQIPSTSSLDIGGAITVEVPEQLARRIANNAMWALKTPEQFVLAMLEAAFPEKTGAA